MVHVIFNNNNRIYHNSFDSNPEMDEYQEQKNTITITIAYIPTHLLKKMLSGYTHSCHKSY